MRELSPVLIKDRSTGELVEATLIDGVSRSEVDLAESDWRSARIGIRRQHSHWDWRLKHQRHAGILAYRIFGIERDKQMQGLMLLATASFRCRIPEQSAKDLVYVDYLESAPWNLPGFVPASRFGLVGQVLIAAAIQVSLETGFKGRIGLHSLKQSESFYRHKCRMTELGPDSNKQNLVYFEMNSAQAAEFLR